MCLLLFVRFAPAPGINPGTALKNTFAVDICYNISITGQKGFGGTHPGAEWRLAFGNHEAVQRTVAAYMQAGASAIHLEDQASPKRCGHLGGVKLIEDTAMTAKLEAAVEARGSGDMLIKNLLVMYYACTRVTC